MIHDNLGGAPRRELEDSVLPERVNNLPKINGLSQPPGREFHATGMTAELDDLRATFEADLAGAYPAEAGVR